MRTSVTMSAVPRQFVFGYGALAAELPFVPSRELRDDGFVADLPGFARGWGVAMDNRRDLPGYKYYTAPDGTRPPVFVSFLDVVSAPGATVNGLCVPVDAEQLTRLDRRERNYSRLDVSDRVSAGGARVWVYVGTPSARERLSTARHDGRAVIEATYLAVVEAAFAALGADELARCRPSLAPGELPVRELVRHAITWYA
jgi:gamma-glutamyl AIG2-like cyclotransferase